MAHLFCILPMLISIISCFFFSLFFFLNPRNPGITVHTRGPREPQTPRPPWTAVVALQWWRAKVATPEMVSTHSTDDTMHIVCPFELSVNIRLVVFVYSCFVRPSVYTRCVYQCVLYCTCAYKSYICNALFKEHSLCLFISASTYSIMAEREPLTCFPMQRMFFMCRSSDLGIIALMRQLLSEPD